MIERTTLTVTSTSATGFGAERHEETRIIPRQATIQDLIDMLELCDTSDRVDQVAITGEEPVKDLYMLGTGPCTDGQVREAAKKTYHEHMGENIKLHVPRKPSDGLSDPDPSSQREDETGKREEGPKEEHMKAMMHEAEQVCKQWEKTRRLL